MQLLSPFWKKRNLDNTMLSNYRPISNLPFIGKIIEKVVFNQLNNNLNSNGYLDNFQSGFRVHHSTEMALIKIINDIRFNSDSGKISVLVLLDLSAAFDTVDHNILLERLENWVGLSGMALKWFRSYLEGRGYYVSIGEHKSKWTSMTCGVPQGSILAPLLFSLYMLPLSQIMRKNQIAYHSYADDTQIYIALSPNDYSPIDSLCQCIDEINSWINRHTFRIRIRIRMSFIGQVCLHIRGICYSDKAPQCDRMTATGQDTDNKRTIYKYTNRQCNIQIGNVITKTLCNTDNHVCTGLTCKFEMEKN